MSTDVPAVVRTGHDLVRNLGHLPPETATMEIATHIRKFWEPRMRHELLARVRWGDTTLHPLLVAAADDLVDGESTALRSGSRLAVECAPSGRPDRPARQRGDDNSQHGVDLVGAGTCRDGTSPVRVDHVEVHAVGGPDSIGLVEQLEARCRGPDPAQRVGELAQTEHLQGLVRPLVDDAKALRELEGEHQIALDQLLVGQGPADVAVGVASPRAQRGGHLDVHAPSGVARDAGA